METIKLKRKPRKTSDRKRPNKSFINKMAAFRGYMTGNEKTQLASLDVKNVMQRVNNRSMSDDVNENFSAEKNKEIQKLIKSFVKEMDDLINQ